MLMTNSNERSKPFIMSNIVREPLRESTNISLRGNGQTVHCFSVGKLIGQGANCLFPFVRPRIFVKVGLGVDIPAICRQAEHDKIAKIHRLHNRRGQAPIAAQSHVPKEVKNVCRRREKHRAYKGPLVLGLAKARGNHFHGDDQHQNDAKNIYFRIKQRFQNQITLLSF